MMYRHWTVTVWLLCGLLACSPAVIAQSPVGTWVTIDDETGEARSHIEIYESGGRLYGKIVKTLNPNAEIICTTCSGKRAGQPYIGMEIISGAEPDGPNEWDGGEIYDPEADKSYGLVLWLERGDGDVLNVRGKHWTGLYRTQQWRRLTEPEVVPTGE